MEDKYFEYHEFGWKNDSAEIFHAKMLKVLATLLPTDGSAILDIGCGNGFIANTLIKNGYNVYGIDASSEGIEIANLKNPGRFYVNDVVAATLPEEIRNIPFKTIISTEVIEHLYSPQKYVAFVKGILQQNGGGVFLVSTPYHGYLKNLAVALTNRMDYHFCPLWEGGHIKFWSRKTLTALLENEGFHNCTFRGVCHFPLFWKIMLIRAEIG